ncbi:MAG TPA: response regulator [Bacteroidota bacterium]|nr:response regulator [Bacteroidota bacterium]
MAFTTTALNIVIIEDNQDHARILKWAFDQNERRDRLTFFADPQMALNYIASAVRESIFKPDLILLDLNLPKIDGREVLRTLKSDDASKSIPVVVLSSSDREEDVQQAYFLGANTYISKSLLLNQLTPALKTVLDYWSSIAQLPSRKQTP